MKWLRSGASPWVGPMAMIGARAGDEVLVLGADDGALPAELARVTGLNGRTIVLDPEAGAERVVERAAQRAGTLVEFVAGPVLAVDSPADRFHIVVVNALLGRLADTDRAACLAEMRRVLVPGGRLVVVEGGVRHGLIGTLMHRSALAAAAVQGLLESAGYRAARAVGELGGTAYYEGRKPRA